MTRVISRSKDDAKHTARPYSRTVVNKVINEGKAVMMSNTMREDKEDRQRGEGESQFEERKRIVKRDQVEGRD